MGAEAIRVGISGLGRSGWSIHASALRTIPQKFKVVAVTDPIRERAEQAKRELGATPHESFEKLIADPAVELVVVAPPNPLHASQARQALQAGKHVLCEKPFGLTTADVDAMIAASVAAKRVLQPFQQRRFEPDFRKVKEICDSGLLGEIEFVRICWHAFKRRWDWQTMREKSGGTMNNNGPHLIDHALELFGGDQEPAEVWCDMKRCLCSGDAEDHFKLVLRGPGRPTVEVELSDVYAYAQDRWLVCGTRGGLRGDGNKLEWKWVDFSKMPPRPVDPNSTPDRSYNSEKLEWQTGSWVPAQAADTGSGAAPAPAPVLELYDGLYAAIREGKPQVITPQAVRKRVAILERARKASGFYK